MPYIPNSKFSFDPERFDRPELTAEGLRTEGQIPNSKFQIPNSQNGQLLLEVLVSVAVAAVVIGLVAQLTYVSLVGNKTSIDRNVALGLVNETFEAVHAVATQRWQSLFTDTAKGGGTCPTNNYYPAQGASGWNSAFTAGCETVTINGIAYTRSFTVQNVCRDTSTRAITGLTDSSGSAATCVTSGGVHDPSTQKINTTVSWPNAAALTSSEYVTRWRNKICVQTDWTTVGAGPLACPPSQTAYDIKTNITAGANLTLCSGGC